MTVRKVLFSLLAVVFILLAAAGYFLLRYSGPYLSGVLYKRAASAETDGRLSRAAYLYEEAVRHDPENIDARLAFAKLNIRMGNGKRAEEELLACLDSAGDNTGAYVELAGFYVKNGRLADAVTLLSGIKSTVVRSKVGALRPPAPEFFPVPGRYGSETEVSAKVKEGTTCYYTIDSTFPTLESARWEQALPLPLGVTTIRAVAVAENGMVSDIAEAVYQIDDLTAVVTFKDETVEALVRAALSRYTGHVTIGDLRSISALSNKTEDGRKIGGEIRSFSDFQHFRGLRALTLSDLPGLPDLNGLTVLTGLETLRLVNCGLTDRHIVPLRSLTTLATLDLSDNRVTSLSSLAELVALTHLSLESNFITDTTPLLLLPKLAYLDLSGNRLDTIEAVGFLAGLETLGLSRCGLKDIGPVASLKNLIYLDVSGNRLQNLEAVASCTRLETLIAGENLIGGLYPLSGLSYLKMADLRGNRVMSLRPLAGSASLHTLNISRNQVSDLSPLASCKALKTIFAAGNPLDESSISVFRGVEIYAD